METTPLDSVGEFGLIQKISESTKLYNSSTIKGIGDDAAVLNPEKNRTLVSTDLLVEGVHFNLTYCPLRHLGYKSVIVNLSDIYAMGGTPRQITVSLALSSKFTLEAVEELYAGIHTACKKYSVDLVGGDTTTSNQGLVISVTAIGYAHEDKIALRSGAQKNDLICVSGNLGSAYAGLLILEREKRIFAENPQVQPDLEAYPYVLERQLKPEARKDIVEWLEKAEIHPTSMIDVSDGLASEVIHLCNNSETGCRIDMDKIPVDTETLKVAEEVRIDPIVMALNGGEDYELLFTIKPSDYQKIQYADDIHIIGFMTEKEQGFKMVDKHNVAHDITPGGWNSFSKD